MWQRLQDNLAAIDSFTNVENLHEIPYNLEWFAIYLTAK